jgi:DNA repair protein RadD
MELRTYQREAVNSIYQYFGKNAGNPLIVMPTASGKSFVLAAFIKEVLETWSDQRIMVLTHVKELIQQNFLELTRYWPLAPAGIYSAGLNRREAQAQVLFAGIQSVHSRAEQLQSFDLIMVDECHLIPRKSDTMYRRFLDDMIAINDKVKIIGLTATHYRLDSGLLTEGDSRIFTDIAFEVPVKRLINEGFLSPLVTKAPNTSLDVSGVHTRGGDFINSELQNAVDNSVINKAAVREIVHYGHNRKSWLVFCTGIQHAYNVRDALRDCNILAETVTGETNSMERDYILEGFKSGDIRALTNCDILTTGFNAPNIDLLAILRPTQSTGLYVQIVGRGMRIAPGKENCVILDFAGNIERHGPIDMVQPHSKKGNGKGKGEAPVKKCPRCRSVVYAGFTECPDCGYVFPPPDLKINPEASSRSIISSSEPFWVDVDKIIYRRHQKLGKPDSLRVDYHCGLLVYSEWICIEHTGYAQRTARNWWSRHNGDPTVLTVSQALSVAQRLYAPTKILVREDGNFWRIMRHQFAINDSPPVSIDEDWPEEECIPVEEEEAPF